MMTTGLAILNLSAVLVQALEFAYTTNNVTITIVRYAGSGGNVIVPETIDNLPVTRPKESYQKMD